LEQQAQVVNRLSNAVECLESQANVEPGESVSDSDSDVQFMSQPAPVDMLMQDTPEGDVSLETRDDAMDEIDQIL
ncbi:unnamed protein product, partial [Allacma fusca]